MTEQQAIAKLVSWCNGEIGYHEGASNYNKYSEIPDVVMLLGWKPQNEPWCDTFTDAAFVVNFGLENASRMTYQPIGKGSAACRYSAAFFRDAGAFYYQPRVGDVVFFISAGAINHQGIVTNVSDGVITTVEGNSGDSVSRRVYNLPDSRIAGFGRPKWSVVAADPDDSPADEIPVIDFPTLKQGDKGEPVWAVQTLLIGRGYYCGGKIRNGKEQADGDFGEKTRDAVINFKTLRGLGTGGDVDTRTWAALLGL